MKIIIIDHSKRCSGGQWSLVDFCREVVLNQAAEVLCVVDESNGALINALSACGVVVEKIDFKRPILPRAYSLLQIIRREVKRGDSLVVYGNTFEGGVWSGASRLLFGVNSVVRVRLSPVAFSHGLIDIFILYFNRQIICNSQYVRRDVQRRLAGAAKKCEVIYSPVSPVKFRPRPLKTHEVVVAVVGRFEAIKAQVDACYIAYKLKRIFGSTGFRFLLIGSPDTRDNGAYYLKVLSAIERYEVGDVVSIVLDRQIPGKVYSDVDICITLSSVEALSRVMFEGGLRGCVNVAVRSGGNVELVDHGRTGFLYPIGDLDKAVSYLQALLSDSILITRFSHAGRCKLTKLFSPAETWKKEYRLLIR
jgi:glycosyltransferase involved in cell wall biosynthesis